MLPEGPAWQLLPSGIQLAEPEAVQIALLLPLATEQPLVCHLSISTRQRELQLLSLGSPHLLIPRTSPFSPIQGFSGPPSSLREELRQAKQLGRCWDEFLSRDTQKMPSLGGEAALITSSSACAVGNELLITPEPEDSEHTDLVWKQSLTPALNPTMCRIPGAPTGISSPLSVPSSALWVFLGRDGSTGCGFELGLCIGTRSSAACTGGWVEYRIPRIPTGCGGTPGTRQGGWGTDGFGDKG